MQQNDSFDDMADLCIMAGQAVMSVGSSELRVAMRLVLGILGQEIVARTAAPPAKAAKAATGRSTKRAGTSARKPARLAPCA